MKFILEVDLDAGALAQDPATELGRILRYWGGSVKQLEFDVETEQDVYDSAYSRVGTWRLKP